LLPLHLAAIVTLSDGLNHRELEHACKRESEALNDSRWHPLDLQQAITERLMPSYDDRFTALPIMPNIVGEALIARVFQQYSAPQNTILRAFSVKPGAVAATLVRMQQDLALLPTAALEMTTAKPLVWLEAVVAAWGQLNEPQIREVGAVLPLNSVTMSRITGSFHVHVVSSSNLSLPTKANSMRIAAIALRRLGRIELAERYAATACDALAALTAVDGSPYTNVDRIMAMIEHAGILLTIGRIEAACLISRQALALTYSIIRRRRRHFHSPLLVVSLTSYSRANELVDACAC
jgi:hypothetical protein